MYRACLNCTAGLTTHNKSDFCSRLCSDTYWAMDKVQPREKEKTMAKKTEVLVTLVDDLTGEEFKEGEGETMPFTFDGEKYELDLSAKNAKTFRTAMSKYVKASRVVTGRRSTEPSEAAQIRAWASENGKEVNDRGRIPQDIVDAYKAAQSA